ncbi:hypothetical protein [Methylobacterium brachiatum]|uniref:hypothetical protein n=1 Tax=Methylobacterium brachiatum TaxID=269660 RepID=UPI0027D8408A|nr:hypothetical protein [Methylobacterium brachiatum]
MTDAADVSSTSPTGRDLDRARRAARARARRAAKGATPRSQSFKAQLDQMGVKPSTHYAQQRRRRLKRLADDQTANPGMHTNSYPEMHTSSYPEAHTVSYPAHEFVPETAPTTAPETVRLYSDLWGGWVPVPPIRTPAAASVQHDHGVSRADALIAAVANLPGGDDPAFRACLRRLVEAAEAR